MNISRARNPERLLLLLAPEGLVSAPDGLVVSSPAAEFRFMRALHSLSAEDLRPLLVIMGGFMDAVHGNAYSILHRLSPTFRSGHDIFYREYPEAASVRELVECYASRGKSVTLIGHSWGADACVYGVASKTTAHIDRLITLDPVSRKGAPTCCPASVRHWRNIHLDYHRATWFDKSNNVARIGGPWEAVACAHENILAPQGIPHNHGVALALMAFGESMTEGNDSPRNLNLKML